MTDGDPAAPGSTPEVGETPSPIRLALLDEHGLDAEQLSRWMQRHASDIELVAVAAEWPRFVQHPAFPSDAVVLDADPVGPVSLTARVRACRATGAAVVLLGRERRPVLAKELDATLVVVASGTADEFVRLARAVRDAVAGIAPRRFATASPVPRLSAGELHALRLYAAGATTADVAEQMGVGYETVKTYLRRVRAKYAKVGRPASRRAELVRRAADDGLLD